jgi:hypothetical protein
MGAAHRPTVPPLPGASGTRGDHRHRRLARLVAVLIVVALTGAACTWTRTGDDQGAHRLGARGITAADWEIGADGGVLSTPDGVVTVQVAKGQAQPDTRVRVQRDDTPRAAGLAGFVPLTSFDISAQAGRLSGGTVSVRYDNQRLQRLHASPELLVMLISDDRHGWLVLPTSADPTSGRASAGWPHFSSGILGLVRSPMTWLVDHVLTYPLGPKKPATCTKKTEGWTADAGWTFRTTNWDGGRMLLAPLDGCAATAPVAGGQHPVEITNRYWYAFRVQLPANADITIADVLDHTDLLDALLAAGMKLRYGEALVPGHSRAHLHVQGRPAGQQLRFQAHMDPVSFLVYLAMSLIDLASLGEARAVRASLEAAESALWEGRGRTGDRPADIAAKTADGSPWRDEELRKAASPDRPLLERMFDTITALDCAYGIATDLLPDPDESLTAEALRSAWESIGRFATTVLAECRRQLALAAFGKAFKYATPSGQAELLNKIARSALDLKTLQSSLQGSLAGLARQAGSDYLRAVLHATQARDPRVPAADANPLERTRWSKVIRSEDCIYEADGFGTEIKDVRFADVTGDGIRDALVIVTCEASTSSWPEEVQVFDGSSPPTSPTRIGRLLHRDPAHVRGITLGFRDQSVIVHGRGLSEQAPLCCPDLLVDQSFTWTGRAFKAGPRQVRRR